MQLSPDSVIEERLVKTFPNTRLLSLVVSRTLRELFIEIIEENRSDDAEASSLLPREQWARAFERRIDRVLRQVASRLGYEPPSLVESLLNDALDPNTHRTLLLDEVQCESFDADLEQSGVIGPDS